ncbi:MAG: ABC transporter ATP-binding protein [Candidatus Dojkabacteria bacterium]
MSQLIVKAKDVKKIYNQGKPNEVHALRDGDLEIEKGEVIAIMGPSGSGKTTLLNCISGIDTATSGEILVAGEDLQRMPDRKKTKYRAAKMGFVFQTFNLIPVLSASENVEMPLLVNGFSGTKAKKKAAEMLARVGLGDRLDHKPSELSGGQRQRVTIARALVHEPDVVWADEPTGNLDTKTAQEVIDLMFELNKNMGVTLVMVTHDRDVADQAERIIKIENGKVIDHGK